MDEEIQQKYIEIQTLNSQIKQIYQQILALEQQAQELKALSEGLDDLKKAKKGTEVLAMLSNGVYIKAVLQDNEEVIMNVGAKTAVCKKVEEVKSIAETQIQELTKLINETNSEFQECLLRLYSLEKEMQRMKKEK